jgi:hypothetical protein
MRTKPVSHPMFIAKQKELKEKEMMNEKKYADINPMQDRDKVIERVNAWPEWKRNSFSYRANPVIPTSMPTTLEDWTKHWQPCDLIYTNPCPGGEGYKVIPAPDVSTVAYGGYTPAYPEFHHIPLTLTWNGQHYVPDFTPEKIQVKAYHQEDYNKLSEEYRKAKNTAVMAGVLEREVNRLKEVNLSICDRIDYLTEKNDAYRKVWSAREYMFKLGDDAAYIILTRAMWDIRHDEFDGSSIRAKYARINTDGIDLSVREKQSTLKDKLTGHEDTLEEHSI